MTWVTRAGAGPATIVLGDSLELLRRLQARSVDLVYIDPPFNTGKVQEQQRIRVVRDEASGDRIGFQGRRYRTQRLESRAFDDVFDDFVAFLEPRLRQIYRLLKANGSLMLHLDYREVHYAKVVLDRIFGRKSFINEIIWAYDYGGRPKTRWPAKHDNILWYARDPKQYTYNYDAIDRIPYMAPALVGPEKAARGKTPTDVWWHTIVPTNSKERTGYPAQKPLGILRRLISVHSNPGDLVLDCFAGSGTTGEAAARLGRRFLLADNSAEAFEIMAERLRFASPRLLELGSGESAPEPEAEAGQDQAK